MYSGLGLIQLDQRSGKMLPEASKLKHSNKEGAITK